MSQSSEEELVKVFCSNCQNLITNPEQLNEDEELYSNESVDSPIKPNTEPIESLDKVLIKIKPKLMQLHTVELPEI